MLAPQYQPTVSTFDPSPFDPSSLSLHPSQTSVGSRFEVVPHEGPGTAIYVRQPSRSELVRSTFLSLCSRWTRLTWSPPRSESQQRRLWIPQATILLPGSSQQAFHRYRREGSWATMGVRRSSRRRAGGSEQGLLNHVEQGVGAVRGEGLSFMLESRGCSLSPPIWRRLVYSQKPQF